MARTPFLRHDSSSLSLDLPMLITHDLRSFTKSFNERKYSLYIGEKYPKILEINMSYFCNFVLTTIPPRFGCMDRIPEVLVFKRQTSVVESILFILIWDSFGKVSNVVCPFKIRCPLKIRFVFFTKKRSKSLFCDF
jgi:hypothetical protein